MDKPDIDAVHAYLISLRPFTPQQFIAIIDKAKEDELEIASTEAADPRDALFNPGQLQELAEKVKKYGFEITPALAADLQRAARYFRTRRWEYHKTLRLSEERITRPSVTCLPS